MKPTQQAIANDSFAEVWKHFLTFEQHPGLDAPGEATYYTGILNNPETCNVCAIGLLSRAILMKQMLDVGTNLLSMMLETDEWWLIRKTHGIDYTDDLDEFFSGLESCHECAVDFAEAYVYDSVEGEYPEDQTEFLDQFRVELRVLLLELAAKYIIPLGLVIPNEVKSLAAPKIARMEAALA